MVRISSSQIRHTKIYATGLGVGGRTPTNGQITIANKRINNVRIATKLTKFKHRVRWV